MHLDLSNRTGIGIRELNEALQDYWMKYGEKPDALVLHLPAAPIMSKAGRWGSFQGIPIMYKKSE